MTVSLTTAEVETEAPVTFTGAWTELTTWAVQAVLKGIVVGDFEHRMRAWPTFDARAGRSQLSWRRCVQHWHGRAIMPVPKLQTLQLDRWSRKIVPQQLSQRYDRRLLDRLTSKDLAWRYSAFVSAIWVNNFEFLPDDLYANPGRVWKHLLLLQDYYLTFVGHSPRKLWAGRRKAERIAYYLAIYEASLWLMTQPPAFRPLSPQAPSIDDFFDSYPQARRFLLTEILGLCHKELQKLV
jgi:hypothetical protein